MPLQLSNAVTKFIAPSRSSPWHGSRCCAYFIGAEYSYGGSSWTPTKAATVGKKQCWSPATSWRLHGGVHAPFSMLSWTFSQAARPAPLPAQVWDGDIWILCHQYPTVTSARGLPGTRKAHSNESPGYKIRRAFRESIPCTPERAVIKLSNY